MENGVADHLSRIRVDNDVRIDDSLPIENVYKAESTLFGNVRLTSDKTSINIQREVSIKNLGDHHDKTPNDGVIVDIDINVAVNLTQTDIGSPDDRSSTRGCVR